jgi:putative tricarboxylic transport membrane protein
MKEETMKTTGRMRIVCVVLGASLVQPGGIALAQGWKPERTVELVVGAGAGGGNDNTARVIQKLLQDNKFVPVPINVINKPGAGGAIAISYMQQNADRINIIGVSSNTLLTNHITKKNAPNPADITPLAILIHEYISFNVNVDSPIKDGKDLLAKLKADPSSVVLGISSALGNINHIAFAVVAREAGLDPRKVKTVVFNSSSASITALLGGHIDLVVGPVSIAGQRVASGQIRSLGVTAPTRRTGTMAAVPTWRELGLDAIVDNWRGIIGPKGMPSQQVAYWDQAFARMFELDEWKKDLEKNYWDNAALTSRASSKYLDTTYQQLKRTLAELALANN